MTVTVWISESDDSGHMGIFVMQGLQGLSMSSYKARSRLLRV
jgi:hypothetical protein